MGGSDKNPRIEPISPEASGVIWADANGLLFCKLRDLRLVVIEKLTENGHCAAAKFWRGRELSGGFAGKPKG